MNKIYWQLNRSFRSIVNVVCLCSTWLLYSCHGAYQLGMDRIETTEPNIQDAALGDLSITDPDNNNAEAVSTRQAIASRTLIPQVVQDPYNDRQAFYEVPNL